MIYKLPFQASLWWKSMWRRRDSERMSRAVSTEEVKGLGVRQIAEVEVHLGSLNLSSQRLLTAFFSCRYWVTCVCSSFVSGPPEKLTHLHHCLHLIARSEDRTCIKLRLTPGMYQMQILIVSCLYLQSSNCAKLSICQFCVLVFCSLFEGVSHARLPDRTWLWLCRSSWTPTEANDKFVFFFYLAFSCTWNGSEHEADICHCWFYASLLTLPHSTGGWGHWLDRCDSTILMEVQRAHFKGSFWRQAVYSSLWVFS